ncbi:alpha-1,6-glucosidase domain-containing protein [Pseudoduganella namucuonensis]|uniref:Alpha-1,6-glucosidases, pullulanase-type n=1 Tax=Pseudoduganella namucuonensis TaxID=1035707 RepID=A0A1I7FIP7_9BURK|nr:alpha-1,6-glucosidase domain-containing protein [Pseudoduganella namucuonensis]SFU36044.1 alpha-1,6-glucosidases, pullulanase-type [Pseudoduganella namucuonensis]
MAGKSQGVRGHGGKLSLGAALVLTAFGAQAQTGAPDLASCDAPFQTVLQQSAAFDARAVWLDRQLAKWPGADAASSFKLYHSATGRIDASPGARVGGADGSLAMTPHTGGIPAHLAARFKYLAAGPVLAVSAADQARLPSLLKGQLVLVREAADGTVRDATTLQTAGALDDIYAAANQVDGLGVTVGKARTGFKLWAPTARQAALCVYDTGDAKASSIEALRFDTATGVWSANKRADLSGKYYKYLVDVVAPGMGLVRNAVTDPYSVSLTTDSRRSYIADLDAPKLKPAGWDKARPPTKVAAQTDMSVYELHVRDFSINDATVSAANRGKYTAFTEAGSNGMKHLAALSKAGLTDIHLLPVYDIGSVPEKNCAEPRPAGAPDGDSQQALVAATQGKDCYNWGYDPYHYSAPEGSYATDPADGARRVIEFRQMVMALHKAGLRVGMDVVYNHTYIAGQNEKSVLDRVVPGYYHRLDAKGGIERSTCCDNTATENMMMAKLMIDSAELWTRHYKIDSFRFDLMGHQPRAAMEALQTRVDKAAGRPVNLIGEGWNFGEVENGARFVQASQLSLNGSGIGTFSDRGRDAVRGGGAGDGGNDMFARQGYINGLVYDANTHAGQRPQEDLLRASDLVKVGLAGTLRTYQLKTYKDAVQELQAIDYAGQPAGYASEPSEVVNYVENHDNQTLYDVNVFKLPVSTSGADRARVQILGAAINTFSQGVAYYHAGMDILRSKSLDRNSFESGDWFNRLDWTYQDNYYGVGLPPAADNGKDYALLKPLLANAAIKPAPADIAFARDAFRDLLRIRGGSTLFRMRTAADIKRRLHFLNTGSAQVPTVVAARLDGAGYAGAGFKTVTYLINVDKVEQSIVAEGEKGKRYRLHPVHTAAGAADQRAKEARYDGATGRFTVPARTAVVFVE